MGLILWHETSLKTQVFALSLHPILDQIDSATIKHFYEVLIRVTLDIFKRNLEYQSVVHGQVPFSGFFWHERRPNKECHNHIFEGGVALL